ncbi:MAG: hypothetical protein M3137_04385 [Actinomycetota bacterium]|nr:hypothetical protein [Actinomycetota bacterium]
MDTALEQSYRTGLTGLLLASLDHLGGRSDGSERRRGRWRRPQRLRRNG